jgi:hypothetical protein
MGSWEGTVVVCAGVQSSMARGNAHGTWNNSWAERRVEHCNDLLHEGGTTAI